MHLSREAVRTESGGAGYGLEWLTWACVTCSPPLEGTGAAVGAVVAVGDILEVAVEVVVTVVVAVVVIVDLMFWANNIGRQ